MKRNSTPVLVLSASLLVLGSSALAQADIPADACLYRNNKPVWHFIPATQVENDAFLENVLEDYPILRETGGVATQDQLYGEDGARLLDEIYRRDIEDSLRSQEPIGALGIFLPPDSPSSDPKDSSSGAGPDATIRGLGGELTQYESSVRKTGYDATARIPYGGALNPGWHYLRVTMARANLSYDRRFWKKYYPALYTELNFDSFGKDTKAVGISAEDSHYDQDRRRVNRTLVMNQVVLPPTPYIDGELRAEISVLAIESFDYGRAFLNFLSSVTDKIGPSLLSEAEGIFDIIDDGIRQLAGTDAEKQFLEVGVAIDWPRPRTGYWLLLWPNDDFVKAYIKSGSNTPSACVDGTPMTAQVPWRSIIQNRTGGGEAFSVSDLFRVAKIGPSEVTLLAKRTVSKRGEPTQEIFEPLDVATYALIRVDALSTNPNWLRIPGLLEAQQKIVERMLQFYLPEFERTGSYLDFRTPLTDDENSSTGAEEAEEEEQQTLKDEESFFKEQLSEDLKFYYGLLMSSPDLLSTDKYRLIEAEQLRFQRYLHVLRTAELRDQLVAEGYRRWREQVRRDDCKKLDDQFKGVAGRSLDESNPCYVAPPEETSNGDEESNQEETTLDPEDTALEQPQEPATTPEDPQASIDVLLSSQYANARILDSFSSINVTVDRYMAEHPEFATQVLYKGPQSIDGTLINAILGRDGGLEVRNSVENFLFDIMYSEWVDQPRHAIGTLE